MLKKLFTKTNCRTLLEGTFIGLSVGLVGTLFSSSVTTVGCSPAYEQYFFLRRHEDLADSYSQFHDLLRLYDGDNFDTVSDEKIKQYLNVLAGIDELIDQEQRIPLHLIYTAMEICHGLEKLLNNVIHRNFSIPSLHMEVLESVERIHEIVKDILYNVYHETNIRIDEEGVLE